jgi:hypothetical protein
VGPLSPVFVRFLSFVRKFLGYSLPFFFFSADFNLAKPAPVRRDQLDPLQARLTFPLFLTLENPLTPQYN